jgi:hypothetical protein
VLARRIGDASLTGAPQARFARHETAHGAGLWADEVPLGRPEQATAFSLLVQAREGIAVSASIEGRDLS